MKKQKLNARVKELALQIHRGFLAKETSDTLTDEEILYNIPENGLTNKRIGEDAYIMVNKPFTLKAIRRAIKKHKNITAYEILTNAGFIVR